MQSTANLAITFEGNDPYLLAYGIFPDTDFGDSQLAYLNETRTTYPNPEGDIFLFDGLLRILNMLQPFDAGDVIKRVAVIWQRAV